MAELETIIDELYGLDPDAFMAARTAAAQAAKADGNKPLAAAVQKLRRPTRSAWLVNLLSRTAADELTSLLDLGEELAAAQESLSGPELRRLSTQRNQLVQALAGRAVAIGNEHDYAATEAIRSEVSATLQAALADPAVREQVQSGRLDKAHAYSGFGPNTWFTPEPEATTKRSHLSIVPDLPTSGTSVRRSTAAKKGKPAQGETESEAERLEAKLLAAVDQAQAALDRATTGAAAATDKAELADTELGEATQDADQASWRVSEAKGELAAAEHRSVLADRRAREATRVAKAARTTQKKAEAARGAAERALRDLIAQQPSRPRRTEI